MSVFDSEQILEQAAALAKPASEILDKFINNSVGDAPIVTDNGNIPSLADLIQSIINNATAHGGGKFFTSKADGIMNTLDRQFFVVQEDNIFKMYYKNGSVATIIGAVSTENFSTNEKVKLSALPTNDALTQILNGLSNQFDTFEQELQGDLDALNEQLLQNIQTLQNDVNTRAKKGVNNDITQLTALSTPLTIEQGGTGSNTISDARAALLPAGRNRIINGACNVQQRIATPINNGNNLYGLVDRFNSSLVGNGGRFVLGSAILTHNGIAKNAVQLFTEVTSSDYAGTNYCLGINQNIEGVNIYDLRGSPVVVSFLFFATSAGTYSFALRTGNNGKSFVTNFTVPANTITKIIIKVPALPNTEADIPNSSNTGLSLSIGALNEGVYQTNNLGTWQSGNFISAVSNFNYGAVANARIAVTELQLEEGTAATIFERKPIDQVIVQCQRYYEILYGTVSSSQGIFVHRYYKVAKRVTPTITLRSGSLSGAGFDANGGNSSARCPTNVAANANTDFSLNIDAEL